MDRRSEIIELGIELVRRRGFDSFSYAAPAEKLNLRKASLHHHFPKKEDLVVAEAANVARGTLYSHFSSKEEIVHEILVSTLIEATRRAEARAHRDACGAQHLQGGRPAVDPLLGRRPRRCSLQVLGARAPTG